VKRTVVPALLSLAALAVLGGVLVFSLHGKATRQPSAAPAPPADAAETIFLAATAVHLCNVGRTVYDDPAALAKAYQSAPTYPGLDSAQVATLTERLHSDPTLSARLTRQLQATCHAR